MNITILNTRGEEPISRLALEVSSEIINGAQPCNVNRCMVAEALQQRYPSATHIFVDTSSIRFTVDGLRYWFVPPQSVKDFIIKYDRHEAVQPFSFSTTARAKVQPAGHNSPYRWKDTRNNHNRNPHTKKPVRVSQRVRTNGVCHYVPVPTA